MARVCATHTYFIWSPLCCLLQVSSVSSVLLHGPALHDETRHTPCRSINIHIQNVPRNNFVTTKIEAHFSEKASSESSAPSSVVMLNFKRGKQKNNVDCLTPRMVDRGFYETGNLSRTASK